MGADGVDAEIETNTKIRDMNDLVMLHGLGDMGALYRRASRKTGSGAGQATGRRGRSRRSAYAPSPVKQGFETKISTGLPIYYSEPVRYSEPVVITPPLPSPAQVKKFFNPTMALDGLSAADPVQIALENYTNAIRLQHPALNAHPAFVRALVGYGLEKGLVQKYGVRFIEKVPIDALKNFVVGYAVELGKVFQAESEGLDGLGFLPAIAPAAAAIASIGGSVGGIFGSVGGAIGGAAGSVWGAIKGIFGGGGNSMSDRDKVQDYYGGVQVFFKSDFDSARDTYGGKTFEAKEGLNNFVGGWDAVISGYAVERDNVVFIRVFDDYNAQGQSADLRPNRNSDGGNITKGQGGLPEGWNDRIKSAIVLIDPKGSFLKKPFSDKTTTYVPSGWDDNAYLYANDDVALAVANGLYPSGFYHYLLYGMKDGRPISPTAVAPVTVRSGVATVAAPPVVASSPVTASQYAPTTQPVNPIAAINNLIAATGNVGASVQQAIRQVQTSINSPTGGKPTTGQTQGGDGIPVVAYGGEIEVTAERPRPMTAGFDSQTLLYAGLAAAGLFLITQKK